MPDLPPPIVLADVSGCCGHLAGEHGEDGCLHGWEYEGSIAVVRGCDCMMRGPR